jgi:hypothetical protein
VSVRVVCGEMDPSLCMEMDPLLCAAGGWRGTYHRRGGGGRTSQGEFHGESAATAELRARTSRSAVGIISGPTHPP